MDRVWPNFPWWHWDLPETIWSWGASEHLHGTFPSTSSAVVHWMIIQLVRGSPWQSFVVFTKNHSISISVYSTAVRSLPLYQVISSNVKTTLIFFALRIHKLIGMGMLVDLVGIN